MIQESPADHELTLALRDILQKSRGMPVEHLEAHLGRRGWDISRSQLSQHLRRHSTVFQARGTTQVEWLLRPGKAEPDYAARTFMDKTPPLRAWQQEALLRWHATERQGIVQAITGAGKTLIAISAIRDAAKEGVRSLVIVPTTPLVEQWEQALISNLPGIRVARQGGGAGKRWEAGSADVVVSTVQTAAKQPPIEDQAAQMLLVADEAHHYAAKTFRALVRAPFGLRLGLTATLQRQDDGDTAFLIPTLGPIVYELDYAAALAAGVVAAFDVMLHGVDMEPKERDDYRELNNRLERLIARIQSVTLQAVADVDLHGQIMSLAGRGGPGSEDAREYVRTLQELRDLMDSSPAKIDALEALAGEIEQARSVLVFTQTVELARAAARRLNALGVSTSTLTAEHSHAERQSALARFAMGSVKALIAPQLLDEGIDVPDANLAIVLSASRTRRQMVQRMGRVIRPKVDGGAARFVIIFGNDTREDPSQGAHLSFLEEVLPLAQSVTRRS